MSILKTICCCVMMLNVFSCSSTYDKEYSLVESNREKKPLYSDLQLKMSLLNRPIPQDQLMMLAFALNREQEALGFFNESNVKVNAILIRGSSTDDISNEKSNRGVSSFIANDVNAISVLGPL